MENVTPLITHFKTPQTQAATCGYFFDNSDTLKLTLGTNISLFAVTFHRTNC